MSKLNYDALSISERKELLMKVLGVSPQKIAQLKSGEILLSDVLSERIREVVDNPDDTTQCAIVCRNIKTEGFSYETLLPDEYLEHINELKAQGGRFADDEPAAPRISSVRDPISGTVGRIGYAGSISPDRIRPEEFASEEFLREYAAQIVASTYPRPFVRYFARAIDMALCLLISDLIFCAGFKINPLLSTNLMMPWLILSYAIMFSVEPFFLHFFGTTPGKFIFGTKILSADGSRLSIGAGYKRSFLLLRSGYGFVIPFYNLYRMVRSFSECRIGLMLSWDRGIRIEKQQRIGAGRIAAFLACTFAVSTLQLFIDTTFALPPNRGAVTEDEFYENCSYIARYNSLKPTLYSDPVYEVQVENGEVVSVSMIIEDNDALGTDADQNSTLNPEGRIYNHYSEMYIVFTALAGAQPDADIITMNYGNVPAQLANSLKDFSFNYAGLTITNEITYEGYAPDSLYNSLYPLSGDTERNFRQIFTVRKQNY